MWPKQKFVDMDECTATYPRVYYLFTSFKFILSSHNLAVEQLTKQEYLKIYANNYFWRTYDRKEIDFVEEGDGQLFGYEIKWKTKQSYPPSLWLESYPNAHYQCINQENYLEFIV